MRISDWSSDVCSSDLIERGIGVFGTAHPVLHLCQRRLDGAVDVARRHIGIYHTIRQFKCARLYLSEAVYGFGSRFRLRDIRQRLAYAIMACWPCPDRKSTRLNSSH